MTDPTRDEQLLKRTAIVLGIAAAIFVAPSLANAGNATAQVDPQVVEQVVGAQRVSTGVTARRVRTQQVRAQKRRANRTSVLGALSH